MPKCARNGFVKMPEQAFHDSLLTLAACLNKPVLQMDINASRFDAVEKAFARKLLTGNGRGRFFICCLRGST